MTNHRPQTLRNRSEILSDAIAIVDQEYARNLCLDEVAHRVASSRRQLQRIYFEIGNTTFREHLTSVRMGHAADLLVHGPITVREAAAKVSYRQPAQFAKAFHRFHGVLPSDYRASQALPTLPEGGLGERADQVLSLPKAA